MRKDEVIKDLTNGAVTSDSRIGSIVDNPNNKKRKLDKRVDFMLQEHGLDAFVKPVGILTSHTGYFGTTDVSYFLLLKIHNEKIKINNI